MAHRISVFIGRTFLLLFLVQIFCAQQALAAYKEGSISIGLDFSSAPFVINSVDGGAGLPPGDPSALIVGFQVQGSCLTWGYDDTKDWGFYRVVYNSNSLSSTDVPSPDVQECGTGLVDLPPEPNTPPTAVDDPDLGEVCEDATSSSSVLANDSDPEQSPLTANFLVLTAGKGTVNLQSDGTFTYTPPAEGYSGGVSFNYTAVDVGQLASNPASATFEACKPINQSPVVVDHAYGTAYVGKNVLDGATDANGDTLIAVLVEPPKKGTLKLNPDGSFVYTPNAGASGDDQFTYRARDRAEDDPTGLESAPATVTFTPTTINKAPIVVSHAYGTDYAGKNVLEGATDANGDILTAILVTPPVKGALTLNPDGTFVYTPNAGASGDDQFTYKASDRPQGDPTGLESAPATVTLTISADEETDDYTALTDKADVDGYTVQGHATPEQLAAARQIDRMCPKLQALSEKGSLNAGQADLLTLCKNLANNGTTARQTVTALQGITPEEVASQSTMMRQILLTPDKNLAGRLAGVRSGSKGVSVDGLSLNQSGDVLPGSVLESMLDETVGALGGGASADEVNDFGNLGIFLRGDLSSGDRSQTERETAYDLDAHSVTFGGDYRFTDQFFLGVSGSVGSAKITTDKDGGDTEADIYALSLYGSFYSKGAAYVDGIVSYGWSDIDATRNIAYQDFAGNVDRTAQGNTDSGQYYGSVNVGYTFNRGGWTLDPSVRFYAMTGTIDGYQEDGAGGWNLAYGDQDFKSTALSLSGQVSYAFTPQWGVLIPYARVEYTREFEDSAQTFLYNFSSAPVLADDNDGFLEIQADNPDANFMLYTAGVSAQFKYGLSGFVSYNILGDYKNLNNASASFGFRWERTF